MPAEHAWLVAVLGPRRRLWLGGAGLLAGAGLALALSPNRVEVERDTVQMLEALGYAEWAPEEGREAEDLGSSGVVRHDASRAAPGFNLFMSRGRPPAQLMRMDGSVVHTWRQPLLATGKWQQAEVRPDGSLVAIVKWKKLVAMDWNSELLWELPLKVHHDLDLAPDGSIYVLSEGIRQVEVDGEQIPVDDHEVVVVSPGGEIVRRLSLFDLFGDRISAERIEQMRSFDGEPVRRDGTPAWELDVLHANTIEVLRRDVPGLGRAGDLLVSLRNLDLVAVVDAEGRRVLWSWGEGVLERQHHPTVLPNGHVLVYDNGSRRGWSRIVEVDPRSSKIVWQYRGSAAQPFYSETRGSAERLPNGNTLVAESNRGRAFELGPDGEIVWEFLNPELSLLKMKMGTLYRIARIPYDYFAGRP